MDFLLYLFQPIRLYLRSCILLILTIFRLPDNVGNIATWNEIQWELKNVKTIDIELPSLCTASKIGPITFPEKFSFSTLTHFCKRFGSEVFVLENHASLKQALKLAEDIDCVDELYPEIGMFHSI